VTIGRKVVYESPILLTPYREDESIDARELGDFIRESFEAAGVNPADIDTGAVILTGEALRRGNARAVGSLFENEAGRFVCATAGDLFEVTMAAHGSGAVELSRQTGGGVLNIDVGGGTTKVSLSRAGSVERRGVIHVGARLISRDSAGCVDRLEGAAQKVAKDLGISVSVGKLLDSRARELIAGRMLDCVDRFLGFAPVDGLTEELSLTEPMDPGGADCVIFSSGVAEYIYGRETRDYGDLGLEMASGIQRRLKQGVWPWVLHRESTGIRATVTGVSQYSVQVSGDTIALTEPDSLPWRNLRLVHIDARDGKTADIGKQMQMAQLDAKFGLAGIEGGTAWFVRVSDDRRYESLKCLAEGIRSGLQHTSGGGHPQAFIFEEDMANSVGYIMLNEMDIGGSLAFLDCISSQDVDFVDIGRRVEPNNVIPVVVKTLVF